MAIALVCSAWVGLAGCAGPGVDADAGATPDVVRSDRRFEAVLEKTAFGSAIARAVGSNPQVASDAARVRAAQSRLEGARAARRPRLALGLDLQAALLGTATQSGYLPLLQVSQLLFDGGRARAGIEAARLGVAAERFTRETSASQLTLAAVEAWYEVEYQRKLGALMRQSVTDHRAALGKIEDRLAAGAATESDVLIARSRLADAISRNAAARGEEDRAVAGFVEIFGRIPQTLPESVAAPELPARSEAELVATSPRLLALDAEIEVAEEALASIEAARWPELELTLTGQSDPERGRSSARLQSSPRVDILTGGERVAARQEAAARVEELRAEFRLLERQIIRTLAILRSDARVGEERLRAASDAVSASRASIAAIEEQFSAGRASILQVLDARREAVDAEEALLTAERDLYLSGYAALALTGDILDIFGVDLAFSSSASGMRPGTESLKQASNDGP